MKPQNKVNVAGIIVGVIVGIYFLNIIVILLSNSYYFHNSTAVVFLIFMLLFAMAVVIAVVKNAKKRKANSPRVPLNAVDEKPVDQHDIWNYGGQHHVVCNPELCEDETEGKVKAWLIVILCAIVIIIVLLLARKTGTTI